MKYKFLIYKQAILTDLFDKYDISHYTFIREVQNLSQWSINIERDREWFTVIREKFGGEIACGAGDYDFLMTLERDTLQYVVLIQVERDNAFVELWKGYFSFFDFKVDKDKCRISFEPTAWDDYTRVFDQMDIERNILAAGDFQQAVMDAYEFDYESILHVFEDEGYGGPPVPVLYVEYAQPNPPIPNEYYRYSRYAKRTNRTVINLAEEEVPVWEVTDEYRRDVTFHNSDTVSPPGDYWVYDSETIPGVSGVYKWVRRFLGGDYTTFIQEVGYTWKRWTLDTAGSTDLIVFNGAILLTDVIDYYAQYCGLDYASNFFDNDPCPMGGNSLDKTMLFQITNFSQAQSVAVRGVMKLKDFLTMLRDTFNVYWYIDSDGDFRIEHRRYFDFGLSYTYNVSVYRDLTGLFKLNRYEWGKPSLVRFERLEFPFSYFPEWLDAEIEYDQGSIMGNDSNNKSIDWGTDIISMYIERGNLPKKGWALFNVELLTSPFGIPYNKIINTIGALTGVAVQNGRFSSANLLRDLWGYGRLLPTGLVNGNETTFTTIERLRKQPTISIPMCDDMNYNGIFRTELGDGLLESAEYEAKSGMLKMNLIYE